MDVGDWDVLDGDGDRDAVIETIGDIDGDADRGIGAVLGEVLGNKHKKICRST